MFEDSSNSYHTPTGRCLDQHEKCSYWAEHGECEKNPTWMKPNCQLSCKQCQGTAF